MKKLLNKTFRSEWNEQKSFLSQSVDVFIEMISIKSYENSRIKLNMLGGEKQNKNHFNRMLMLQMILISKQILNSMSHILKS